MQDEAATDSGGGSTGAPAAPLSADRPSLSAPGRELMVVEGLSYRIGGAAVLDDVTLRVRSGAPTVLMGPNGSGKTTLLRLLMGLALPSAGRVMVQARSDGAAVRRAFVFQKPVMLKRSAAANIAFALETAGKSANEAAVATLLARVGLAGFEARPARRLSGGEQQRLALARALARQPDILLLDEPTASLDPAQAKAVEDIIATVSASGVKVVLATHDLGQARRLAGEVAFLVRGQIAEQGAAPDFFTHPRTDQARRFLNGELVI